jgi:methyl coenzyme M reductase subunit C-like uncharacterized protein (methanogenesis marker protein 7)
MMNVEQLAAVVEELITVLQLQAQNLERLIEHVEQVTTPLPVANQLSVVRSELAALRVRIGKLRGR